MTIDHIGVVVRDLKSAIEQWETLFGYAQHSDIVENTRQKVRVVFSGQGKLAAREATRGYL